MKITIQSMLVGMMLLTSITASAGGFKLKTAKPVGQTLSVAMNAGLSVTLTWGDGSTESLYSTGQLQDITIKDASLTVSTEKDITSLYLADNELTELNVTQSAAKLRRLFCPNNLLTALDLSTCTALVSLDCQGNKLSTLSVGSTIVEDYNVADNELSIIGLRGGSKITSLVCGNNKLTAVPYLSSMTGLTTLYCQGNQVTSLSISKCVQLKDLLAYDNQLKTLNTLPLVNLKNLWVGNNLLETLDLSGDVLIEGLMAENNNLKTIKWSEDMRRSAVFAYTDLSNNALFFDQFPSMSYKKVIVDGTLGHQEDYQLFGDTNVNVATENIRSLRRHGWDNSHTLEVVLTAADGQTLVANEDYTFTGSSFTFLKPHAGVVIAFSSESYPGLDLKTTPFDVIDPAGIDDVVTDAAQEAHSAYDLQGRKVLSAPQKGIYIVNGKKIVVR